MSSTYEFQKKMKMKKEGKTKDIIGKDLETGETTIRLAFIQKVYSILSVMLIVASGLIDMFIYVTVLAYCEDVRRSYPTNFILLTLFTVCQGLTVGYVSSFYQRHERNEVPIAFGITAAVRQVVKNVNVLPWACYLVVDTQMMMAGNHKYTISTEEYIFAALDRFLDIIDAFIYIFQMLGIVNE